MRLPSSSEEFGPSQTMQNNKRPSNMVPRNAAMKVERKKEDVYTSSHIAKGKSNQTPSVVTQAGERVENQKPLVPSDGIDRMKSAIIP